MTKFKGSTGIWRESYGSVMCDEKVIAVMFSVIEPIDKENTKLIIDAGNVRQQINVDLPELLEQRNELLQALRDLKILTKEFYFYAEDVLSAEENYHFKEKMTSINELITKCKK